MPTPLQSVIVHMPQIAAVQVTSVPPPLNDIPEVTEQLCGRASVVRAARVVFVLLIVLVLFCVALITGVGFIAVAPCLSTGSRNSWCPSQGLTVLILLCILIPAAIVIVGLRALSRSFFCAAPVTPLPLPTLAPPPTGSAAM